MVDSRRDGLDAAREFRHSHRLGNQPIGDLSTLIEQTTGCDVAVLDVGNDEHGLTMRDPQFQVVFIGVARTRAPMRQRSTLAHELAHVIFDDLDVDLVDGAQLSQRTPMEIRADEFARNLLVPSEGLGEMFGGVDRPLAEADLSMVVQRYLVSPSLAAIALERAGLIDPSRTAEWKPATSWSLATKFGWADQYRSLQNESDSPRAPQKLLARAIEGFRLGLVSAQFIANLRSLSVDVVEGELSAEGIVPPANDDLWTPANDTLSQPALRHGVGDN